MLGAYLGTSDGVQRLRDGTLEPLGLAGEHVAAIAVVARAGAAIVLAGTYGDGLRRRVGDGAWEPVGAGLTAPALRCIVPDPAQAGALLAGAEPARIFRSADDGASWTELDGIRALDRYEDWFLPYSPRAGALRNIYAPPGRPGVLLASVEVGGLIRSADAGATWTIEPIIADEDIHFVTGHPDDPDLLFAALGTASLTHRGDASVRGRLGGVARSRDGGRTWEKLERDYTRAVLVPPGRPDLLLAAPALRVGQGGRIVVSADGGDTWAPAGAGIEVPMPDMVELFVPAPDGSVWAICSRGRLLRAEPGTWSWTPLLPAAASIEVKAVAFAGPMLDNLAA
jgi:photosystem II stability/assembly factor-like uncharacterized protein